MFGGNIRPCIFIMDFYLQLYSIQTSGKKRKQTPGETSVMSTVHTSPHTF